MLDTLISAIEGRNEISFTYSGLRRVAQPAAVGVSSTGNVILRCYQTEGGHITPGHEWDLCTVAKIRDLEVNSDVFEVNPPGYKRGDRHMNSIYAQL